MPKPPVESPPLTRPFTCHGVSLSPTSGAEYLAECPLGCGKKKLYVQPETGLWECKVGCGSGNVYDFLRLVFETSLKLTRDYTWISQHRNLPAEALRAWGVCQSFITGEWLVPGYGAHGRVVNLYRYVRTAGKYRLWPTPGVTAEATGDDQAGHGLFKPTDETFPDSAVRIDVDEGVWDAVAWWVAEQELLKADPNRPRKIIVGVPGCGVWKPSWNRLCMGRVTCFLFDNDHPRTNPATNTVTQAAHQGLKRAVGMVSSVDGDDQPKEIRYLCWSGDNTENDPGFNADLADGYDVRDMLGGGAQADQVESMVRPVPAQWTEGKSSKRGANRNEHLPPLECRDWRKLVQSWKRAAKWTPELNGALAVLLASVASVRGQGQKLNIKLMSQPSTFKSQLCSAVLVARRYTVEDDGMNGFFSGYNDAAKGETPKDRSLAGRLWDRTLITKEGATLVDNPVCEKIISEFRALSDGNVTKDYKNGVRWEYQGLMFTWILSGTFGMRVLDRTELGQRFLDYCIVKVIDDQVEDDILDRVVERQLRASKVMSNCKAESTLEETYRIASQLTGGYVNYLRQHIDDLIQPVEVPEKCVERIKRLAKFIEYMRARPSFSQEESVGRSLASRVCEQLIKLTQYLCVVMQKKTADKDIMWVVEKVARDTSDGRTLEIVKVLDPCGKMGLDLRSVCKRTGQNGNALLVDKEGQYLTFLTRIGALELYEDDQPAVNKVGRWRLTDKFRRLFKEVTQHPNWKNG